MSRTPSDTGEARVTGTGRKSIIVFLVLAVVAAGGVILLIPPKLAGLGIPHHPARTYAEAVDRIESLRLAAPAAMNPLCQVQFMTHGHAAKDVALLVHGYTSCPQQFSELGRQLFNRGYNVLIAPLPHHGLSDRMTDEQGKLVAEELAQYANDAVDIARGLGKRVTMVGISAGGVTTAAAAQWRTDLYRAVIISPAFGFQMIPAVLTTDASGLIRLLPNRFDWWNAQKKDAGSPVYTYPRYSTHALAEILRLGSSIRSAARGGRPAAQSIVVVTNAADRDVNNNVTRAVTDAWRGKGASLETFEFDASLNLNHDLIDPRQENQKTELVYPRLVELITKELQEER